MKSVIVLKYSEDGLGVNAFTNAKAIHTDITTNEGYVPVSLSGETNQLIKYSYPNLVKIINARKGKFYLGQIHCEGGSTITLNSLSVVSK